MGSATGRLAGFDRARVARLLEARPDLLSVTSLQQLTMASGQERSLLLAVHDLPWPARQVAEALEFLGGEADVDELAALDPDVDKDLLLEAVEELQTRLLVTGKQRFRLAAGVRRGLANPLGLGRPVVRAHLETSHWHLTRMLEMYDEPRPRSRDAARAALAQVLGHTELLAESLTRMPAPLRELLQRADREGPILRISGVDPYLEDIPDEPGLADALMTGLLAVIGPGRVELPSEVGLAVRWPHVAHLELAAPDVTGAAVSSADLASACGEAVQSLLDAVESVATAMLERPLPLLGSGGVGVKELRALATPAVPPAAVSLVLRLLDELGLVRGTRKDLRVAKEWQAWSAADEPARWLSLVRAWLGNHYLPAARPTSERKLKPALSWDHDPRSVPSREQLVTLLGRNAGRGHSPAEWLRLWHHRWPEHRLSSFDGRGHLVDRELRADLLHEAEVLGLIALGAATPAALAVFGNADVTAALQGLAGEGQQHVKAQADMTLICTGRPSRTMRAALDRVADVEQTGAATVWRVSEQSLAKAYDEGDEPDEVFAVLERYAGKVPQAMAYLVKDAHRRFGRVRVGAATSYVLVDDDDRLREALLKKGAAAKQAKAIGLTRIAPGVAVSKGSQQATVAALKELGLHALTESRAARPRATAVASSRPVLATDLPAFDLRDLSAAVAERLLAGR